MKKGLTSLDALILFIAIVIVVGVAAIVLITSGGSLMQKAMLKSKDAKDDVSSGLEVISVIGSDARPSDPGGTPHEVEYLHIMVRLLPGTTMLRLNNTLIYIESAAFTQTIQFNSTCAGECNAPLASNYMVYYLSEGNYHEDGYVNIGDVAKLSLKTSHGINEGDDIKILLVPANGPQKIIRFQTPENMITHKVTLWPTS